MFTEERLVPVAIAIKRLAAILLVLAFFLPLSQCSIKMQDPETGAIKESVTVTYAYEAAANSTTHAIAIYAAFFWPLALVVATMVWPGLHQKMSIGVLELLFCSGSLIVQVGLSMFGTPLYGGNIAFGSIALYFVATLAGLVLQARKRWGNLT